MRKQFLCLTLISLVFSGCSALMPTRDIKSADTDGTYPQIGDVPQGKTPTLSQEEREKMTEDLTKAREKNQKAASAPITPETP
jgi:hypothetical protein